MMTKERSTKTKILFYSQAWIRQIKYMVIMTKARSTRIVNIMTTGLARVLMLGHDHIRH